MNDSYKIYASKDYVDGKVGEITSLPENTGSNQQLVTNMNGEVAWEERLGYKTIAEVTFLEESETYPQMADVHMHFGYMNSHEFIVGETYKVNFDGTLYECVATQTEGYGIALGNLSYVDSDIYEDTGEPFGCAHLEPGSTILFIIPTGTLDSYYTISVVGPAVVIQPIPGDYIAGGLYKGSGDNSFQMKETQANQMEAIALGNRTVANGRASIAMGADTTTKGPFTIAEGQGTVATVYAQHTQGRYNIEDTEGKYAHIVGNGKREYGVTTASNAYTLGWDGTGWFANGVKIGGAGQDDEAAEQVVTSRNVPDPHQYLTTDKDGNKVWEDKPCYYNVEEVEIFKEASTNGAGGAQLTIENSCSTEEGVACIVTFDGVEYVCYPYEIPDFNTVWGNPSLMGGAVDSGEPFCCSGLTTEMMSIIKFKEAVPHTFSAKSQKKIYQTIDPAYLPFSAKSGEGENSVIIASEMGSTGGFDAVSLNGAIANGAKATAINFTFAEGDCSFSQGYMTHANGYCSAALGGGTVAHGDHQLTIGRSNIEDTTGKYVFIVGNAPIGDDGYVDGEQSSNAHTIDWNGNAWFQGEIKVGGTGQDDQAAKVVATETYVDDKISELGGRPILTDTVTGINYELYVENGKLTMKETGVLGGKAILKDSMTGANYELYVENGNLTMKEAE